MHIKYCGKCKLTKPFIDFNKDCTKPDGYEWQCKICKQSHAKLRRLYLKKTNPKFLIDKRRKSLAKSYGLTLDEYDMHLSTPCEICGDKSEHLDHCHTTLIVRGGLCRACNHLLGNSRDSTIILNRAIKYLEDSCTVKNT